MWRALLGRRIMLLLVALGSAVAITAYRAGPAPDSGYRHQIASAIDGEIVQANLIDALALQYGLTVDPIDLRVVSADDGPVAFGRPFVAWFTAEMGPQIELFSVRGRLSPTGVPVALSAPRDISRTPDGDELLLDVAEHRVLFAVRVGEQVSTVALLDFGESWLPDDVPWGTRAVAAASARQTFGTWDGPRRTDLVLIRPTGLIGGELTPFGFQLMTDDAEIAVESSTSTVVPVEAAHILTGASLDHAPLGLAADVLRRSAVFGTRRVMAIEDVLFTTTDWIRRQRHRVFPTAADLHPVSPVVDTPAVERAWPPGDLPLGPGGGLPGEGQWSAVDTQAAELDPAAVQTFIRVDPDRPYERTHLFAFDSRRLGLQFVAGTRHPKSTTGVRGTGRVGDEHRDRLFAAFNGGFKAEHGRFGTIEAGRPIIRPARGLSTVVTAPDGRAGFGLWDVETLHPPWTALRQNLAPLIEGGVVNPQRVRHWGKLVADLDEARTPRSALGVTEDGVLVYGWSAATSAERLGEAMRRAGVQFAMHLDMNPGHTGLELYRPGTDGLDALRGVPEMDYRERRWLGTDARDFFYIVRVDRSPPALDLQMRATGEGEWTVTQRIDGAAVLSESWLAPGRTGSRRQTPIFLLESDRLRPHVVPGLAEIQPTTGAPPAELNLPSPPLAWFEMGLRAVGAPHGFMVGGQVWRPLQPGIMTFAVDASGRVAIGRYAEGVSDANEWVDAVQGPALVADGQLAEAARGRGTMPVSALGMRRDGKLILAAGLDGDRAALGRALLTAGALQGVLLGERGTIDTGSRLLYFARGERLWMARSPTGALRPARLAVGAGSALVLTGRRPPPAVQILPTFARQTD